MKENNMRKIGDFFLEHAQTLVAGAIGGILSAVILLAISG